MSTSKNTKPEVVGDLKRIHSVMTRAMQVSVKQSESFPKKKEIWMLPKFMDFCFTSAAWPKWFIPIIRLKTS